MSAETAGAGDFAAPPALEKGASASAAARDSRAPRELLPLPLFAESSAWREGGRGGRRGRQRVNRRHTAIEEANDAISAVNWCYGSSSPSLAPPTAAQQEAMAHILRQVKSDGAPPSDLTPQAALEELLGGAAGYGGDSSLVAPYDKDLLSLPQLGAAPTPLESALDGDPLHSLVRFEDVMLKDDEEWGMECERGGHVSPYFDATLARSRAEYKDFVRRLSEAGLVRFGCRSQVVVTPFFVYKKDRRRRVIFDCRPANRRFRPPPDVRLGTASEWAGLRIPESSDLFVGSGDIKDYFYACGIGPKLSEYFSLPPLTAQEIRHLGPEARSTPVCRTATGYFLSWRSCRWGGRGPSTWRSTPTET